MLLFVFIVASHGFGASGKYYYDQDCIAAHENIIRLKTGKAQEILVRENNTHPDNLIPVLLRQQVLFLKAYCTGVEEDFQIYRDSKRDAINKLERGDKTDPFYRYCLAQVHLMSAVARIHDEEYFNAVNEIRKGYVLLEDNNKLFPDFLPDKATLGMLHALIGTIPDQYQWVTKVLRVSGNQKQGIAELKEALSKSITDKRYGFVSSESLIMLTWTVLGMDLLKQESGFMDSYYNNSQLKQVISESSLIGAGYAWYLMKQGRNDDALKMLKSLPEGKDYMRFHYIKYLTGISLLNKADTSAARYFRYYATRHKGKNIIKSAWHRLAWIEILKDNPEGYDKYMGMVTHYGNASGDADKLALKEANEGKRPNIALLKSRLLCDGGYYKQAETTLNQGLVVHKLLDLKDSLECNYRFGRIYQYQGDSEKAIKFYKIVIEKGKNESWYFACSSALILGEMFENLNSRSLSEYYYKLCLDIKPSEYKTSLHMKAKAGLKRLKG